MTNRNAIVQSDGTPKNTHVTVNGEPVKGVQEVTIWMDHEGIRADVRLIPEHINAGIGLKNFTIEMECPGCGDRVGHTCHD